MVTGKATTIRLGPKGRAILKALMAIDGVTQNDAVFKALEAFATARYEAMRDSWGYAKDTGEESKGLLDELRTALRMIGK